MIIRLIFILLLTNTAIAEVFTKETQLYSTTIASEEHALRKPIPQGIEYKVLKDYIERNNNIWQLVKIIKPPKGAFKVGFILITSKLKQSEDQQNKVKSEAINQTSDCTKETNESMDSMLKAKEYSNKNNIELSKHKQKEACDNNVEANINPVHEDLKEKTQVKFQKGCEVLKNLVTDESNENVESLKTCISSLINIGMEKAQVSRAKFEIKNEEGKVIASYPAVSPHIFFGNIYKKLNQKEINFLGKILTSIGEAGSISTEIWSFTKEKPPHFQEMMAINMVLENRLEDVINLNQKHESFIKQAKEIYPGLNNKELSLRIMQDATDMNRTIYHAKGKEKDQLKEIKKDFYSMIRALKEFDPNYKNLTYLDMAMDKNGIAFSMYAGIKQKIKRGGKYPYRGWYKVISKSVERYYDIAVRSYIKFNKIKEENNYQKGVTHYYSTCVEKPEFAKVNKQEKRYPKLEHVSFDFDGQTYYTKIHKEYSSKRGSRYPYSCNITLNAKQRSSILRTGHCFYSNVGWKYYGHIFKK